MIELRMPSVVLRALLAGFEAPRRAKQAIMLAADLLMLGLCFMLTANWVKGWSPPYPPGLWLTLAVTVIGGGIGFLISGLYQSYLR